MKKNTLSVNLNLQLTGNSDADNLPSISTCTSLLKKASRLLHDGGLSLLLVVVIQKMFAPAIRFGSVYFFAGEFYHDAHRKHADVYMRFAVVDDIPALIRHREPNINKQLMQHRFDSGDRCVIAVTTTGQIAHSSWITHKCGYIPEIEMNLVPRPNHIYFYDGYTWPIYRKRGIDGAVRRFIFKKMYQLGFNRVIYYVPGNNPLGLKAVSWCRRPIGRVFYLRIGGLKPFVIRARHLDESHLVINDADSSKATD